MAFDEKNCEISQEMLADLPLFSFVMCGGSGSRLWPLSRLDKPKQFHNLTGTQSLLAATLQRLQARPTLTNQTTIIGIQQHKTLLQAEARDGVPMILEPFARNTASAAAVATASVLKGGQDGLILLCPADHEISTTEQFWQTITQGIVSARQGEIVTFGIPPERPETGYGYIETDEVYDAGWKIKRFVEKPDYQTASSFIAQGNFFWNSGIFLFRAGIMRQTFLDHAPQLWALIWQALDKAEQINQCTSLAAEYYLPLEPLAFDKVIMEKAIHRVVIPAAFRWSDLGSWQSLMRQQQPVPETPATRSNDNVLIGNVVAHDCQRSYLRSESGLLTISGLSDMAVIATHDAVLIAPLQQNHVIQTIAEQLSREQRPQLYYRQAVSLNHEAAVRSWLFEQALPYWAGAGIDRHYGGFYENLSAGGAPIQSKRRSRTMARQIYAFAQGAAAGWEADSAPIIAHGLQFMLENGRSARGGWVESFHADGTVCEGQENLYDQSCMLLALALAYQAGRPEALQLAQASFEFLDNYLRHPVGGYSERYTGRDCKPTQCTSNAHMHLLEACLAWYRNSRETVFLNRAQEIVELCKTCFFDADTWSIREYFDEYWQPVSNGRGSYYEPGHAFEWAALLSEYVQYHDDETARSIARKLYTVAVAQGINRQTGLCYNLVARNGCPVDTGSRSWQQCEALKAAIMLHDHEGHDLRPEIEARVADLFRWHLHPVKQGLWVDRVDAQGTGLSDFVPASILYHLTGALTLYLQFMKKEEACSLDMDQATLYCPYSMNYSVMQR